MKKEKDARGRLIDKYGQVTTRQYLVFVLTLFLIKTGGAAWYPADPSVGCEIVEHSPNGTPVNCAVPSCKNLSFESNIFRWDGHHIIVNDEKRLNRSTMNMSYVTLMLNCEEDPTKIMQIDVLDVNDFPPIFDKGSPSHIDVSEFALPGQTIWTFNASDADWNPGLSPRFTFILKGFLTEKYLKVEGSTEASIIVVKSLDYEHLKNEDLTLILSAEDHCNFPCVTNYPVKTSHFTFTIHIIEEDTLPPIFQPPYCVTFDLDGDNAGHQLACANAMYNGTVFHDTKTINMTTPIRAEDGDEQLNASIAYRILGGNDEKFFSIGDDGKLTLKDIAKKKYNQTYNLEILAVQKNNNFRSALTTAKIRVIQPNNYPPTFCKGSCGYIPSTEYMVVVFECHSLSPLRVLVCDDDYPPQNINPNARVMLSPQDESWATLTPDGYLLVNTSNMPPRGSLSSLKVTAMDLESHEAIKMTINLTTSKGPTSTTESATIVTTNSASSSSITDLTTGPSTTAASSVTQTILSTDATTSTTLFTSIATSSSGPLFSSTAPLPSSTAPLSSLPSSTAPLSSLPSSTAPLFSSTDLTTLLIDTSTSVNLLTGSTINPSTSRAFSVSPTSSLSFSTQASSAVTTSSPSSTGKTTSISDITTSVSPKAITTMIPDTSSRSAQPTATEDQTSTTTEAPKDCFTAADMGLLGGLLGAILFICLLALGFVIYKLCRVSAFKSDMITATQEEDNTPYCTSPSSCFTTNNEVGWKNNNAYDSIDDKKTSDEVANGEYDSDCWTRASGEGSGSDGGEGGEGESEEDKGTSILAQGGSPTPGYKAVWFQDEVIPGDNGGQEMTEQHQEYGEDNSGSVLL